MVIDQNQPQISQSRSGMSQMEGPPGTSKKMLFLLILLLLILVVLSLTFVVLNRRSSEPKPVEFEAGLEQVLPTSIVGQEESDLKNINLESNEDEFQQLRESASQL